MPDQAYVIGPNCASVIYTLSRQEGWSQTGFGHWTNPVREDVAWVTKPEDLAGQAPTRVYVVPGTLSRDGNKIRKVAQEKGFEIVELSLETSKPTAEPVKEESHG